MMYPIKTYVNEVNIFEGKYHNYGTQINLQLLVLQWLEYWRSKNRKPFESGILRGQVGKICLNGSKSN